MAVLESPVSDCSPRSGVNHGPHSLAECPLNNSHRTVVYPRKSQGNFDQFISIKEALIHFTLSHFTQQLECGLCKLILQQGNNCIDRNIFISKTIILD